MNKKIFIILFMLSLAGPSLLYPILKDHIDTANYENRTFAPLPRLAADNFANIPGEFEAFYNDHVPFKNFFVKLYTKIETKAFGAVSVAPVTVGKENWLFYTNNVSGEDALSDYQHLNLYSAKEREELADVIKKVDQGARKQGIRFFLFEAPNKESVYGTYMPSKIRVYGDKSRLDVLIPELQDKNLPVYYLADSLRENKDAYQVYLKYDTHWNYLGAYIASQQISQVMGGGYVPLEELEIVSGGHLSGDMARMLNMAQEFSDDTEYFINGYLPDVKAESVLKTEDSEYEVFRSDSSNDKTLLVLGDSFIHGLKPYLSKMYQNSVFVTFHAYTPELFSQYEVDDFIYLTVERNQKYLENIETILKGEYVEEPE